MISFEKEKSIYEEKNPISLVTRENATPEARAALDRHLEGGFKLTHMKQTLLHSAIAFEGMINASEAIQRELLKHGITEGMILFFNYAVSTGNKCLICGTLFSMVMKKVGIEDFSQLELTEQEQELLDFAEALVKDANHVPDEVYDKLRERYDEETLVLLVVHGIHMLSDNYFNNIVGVELDDYLLEYYDGVDEDE